MGVVSLGGDWGMLREGERGGILVGGDGWLVRRFVGVWGSGDGESSRSREEEYDEVDDGDGLWEGGVFGVIGKCVGGVCGDEGKVRVGACAFAYRRQVRSA